MRGISFINSGKVMVFLICAVAASYAENYSATVAPPGVLFEVLALNKDLPTIKKPKYRSPTDMVTSPDESKIYICEQTAKRIAIFDVKKAAMETERIRLPNEVTGCAVSPDGTTLYATCGSEIWPNGQVCIVDIASRKVTKRVNVGHYPRSPVLTPDGTTLYVCNMFSNDLSVVDVAAGVEKKRISVVREPYSMDITPDGKTLVVGNSLPDDRSTDTEFVSCKISIIDVATEAQETVRLTRGSHSVFGLTISPDGRYAYATHLIGKFNLIGTTVEKGWLHTNNLAVIDLTAKKFVNDVCLDLSLIGMGNPWTVKCTKDGQYMVVAHAGANEISIIHLPEMLDSVVIRTARGEDLQKEFTTMLDSRKRIPVTTKGPRALAIVGSSVYTTGYFDDATATMEEFEIETESARTKPINTYPVGDPQPWNGERNGENNFYDAALCFQKWQSCHSCHPLTRPDALNWILGGGAITAPKNVKSMCYSWWTPPTNWSGRRQDAQMSIQFGVELELFRTPTIDLTTPMDTLFMYLKPMPSPKLVKGRLSESAARGRALYYNKEKVDCITCHPGPVFTDKKLWNAGVPDDYDATIQWDTPYLAETWRTGPYGHLGSYWGVREILELKGHSNAYMKLSVKEMNDLVEYVLSL